MAEPSGQPGIENANLGFGSWSDATTRRAMIEITLGSLKSLAPKMMPIILKQLLTIEDFAQQRQALPQLNSMAGPSKSCAKVRAGLDALAWLCL